MVFSRAHLITYFLLVSIPLATSMTFNLTHIGPQNQNLDIVMEGIGAHISDNGIQLTPNAIGSDQKQKAGRATYFRQLHLWDSGSGELASFTTNFTFVIDSNGNKYYADGLTFFLAQNYSEIYTGGSMGLPANGTTINSTNQFVAVEFDTFWNRLWDPSVSNNTPMGDHVGISISSLSSVRSRKWLSNVIGGGVCQAWIRYDSVLKNLSVSFTGFKDNTVVRQDGLYYTVDLRKVLPEWVIFGFSAATGDLIQKNNVRSWSLDSDDLPGNENKELPPTLSPNPVNGKKSKMGLRVGLMVGSTAAVTLQGVLAFVLWRKKEKIEEEEAEEIGFDVDVGSVYQRRNI